MTDIKAFNRVEIKDEERGEVVAVFSTLNVIDSDQDVTTKGAFEDGAKVRISAYGHTSWEGRLPVGKGSIRELKNEALLEGRFFLDTADGADTFRVVKELGADGLQEWSYGFDPVEYKFGEFEDQQVRFLTKLKVHEVSPVLLGAGVGTRLVSAKSGMKLEAQLESAVADLEALHGRLSEVVTFRTGSGKSRFSEHSVEMLARIDAVTKRLAALRDDPAPSDTPADWAEAFDLLAAAASLQGAHLS